MTVYRTTHTHNISYLAFFSSGFWYLTYTQLSLRRLILNIRAWIFTTEDPFRNSASKNMSFALSVWNYLSLWICSSIVNLLMILCFDLMADSLFRMYALSFGDALTYVGQLAACLGEIISCFCKYLLSLLSSQWRPMTGIHIGVGNWPVVYVTSCICSEAKVGCWWTDK